MPKILSICLFMFLLLSPCQGQEAPGGPGADSVWAPANKSMLGTSVGDELGLYFTGHRGIISEVFYPFLDTVNTVDLQFLIGDTALSFVDEEKVQDYRVSRPDSRALLWQAVTENLDHHWRLHKRIFTDPERNALILRCRFEALDGWRAADFNLYVLHNPAMANSGANDLATTIDRGPHQLLVAAEGKRASALVVSIPWHRAVGGSPMVSHGFVGVNDGWTDLLSSQADHAMDWTYGSAGPGNVAQMGWLDTQTALDTVMEFDLVLAFAQDQDTACSTALASLQADLDQLEQDYRRGWNAYTDSLNDQSGQADDLYYLAAMALKSVQDKSNGAMVAGLGTPWGESTGDANPGGYHLVWPRDLFKFANALLTAGDLDTANRAVEYLFTIQMQDDDCDGATCSDGYSRTGRFPQNSWVSGRPYWPGTQMDETAMPIILAWRLGRTDLWPRIRLAADFLVANGPWTQQERWEENSGYSPSTMAAEIAGLVCAAAIAQANADLEAARTYLATADHWQRNLTDWTFTRTGYHGNGHYYLRINDNYYPDDGHRLTLANGGGEHDERYIVDGGFLELVRLGIKRADDWSILDSLSEYDSLLSQDIAGKGPAWFRYNQDGYGEDNQGHPYTGAGRGRLWPIFTAERGLYEIALADNDGDAGLSYLESMRAFAGPEGFIPEQVWNQSTDLAGWQTLTPPQHSPGSGTGSISPLSWAMGEYITLLASVAANRVVDLPTVVCERYDTCAPTPTTDQVLVDVTATAQTILGQNVYLTGNTVALGNWVPELGIPLDARSYPAWRNRVVLPAGSEVEYKYVRINADGSQTWELLPDNGNRHLSTGAAGQHLTVWDTVQWQ